MPYGIFLFNVQFAFLWFGVPNIIAHAHAPQSPVMTGCLEAARADDMASVKSKWFIIQE